MSALVMVVDDEEDLVSTLEFNLRREGYTARSAFTGESAMRLTAEDPVPDLILLDLMLPDVSGTEICRRLKQENRTRHVPIIMLTAKGEEIDRVIGSICADDSWSAVQRARADAARSGDLAPPSTTDPHSEPLADVARDTDAHECGGASRYPDRARFKLLLILLDSPAGADARAAAREAGRCRRAHDAHGLTTSSGCVRSSGTRATTSRRCAGWATASWIGRGKPFEPWDTRQALHCVARAHHGRRAGGWDLSRSRAERAGRAPARERADQARSDRARGSVTLAAPAARSTRWRIASEASATASRSRRGRQWSRLRAHAGGLARKTTPRATECSPHCGQNPSCPLQHHDGRTAVRVRGIDAGCAASTPLSACATSSAISGGCALAAARLGRLGAL